MIIIMIIIQIIITYTVIIRLAAGHPDGRRGRRSLGATQTCIIINIMTCIIIIIISSSSSSSSSSSIYMIVMIVIIIIWGNTNRVVSNRVVSKGPLYPSKTNTLFWYDPVYMPLTAAARRPATGTSARLCYAMLFYAVLCCAVLHYAILLSSRSSSRSRSRSHSRSRSRSRYVIT